MFGHIFCQRGGIEEFFHRQLGGIFLILFLDFLVGAANQVVVDGEASAAQLGQDFVSQLLETGREVADLLFALLGVGIHGEHAQDDLLVLDVRSLDQFLEAVPVLGGVTLLHIGIDAVGLELLVYVVAGRFLAFFGQGGVDLDRAIGRSVGRHFDVVEHISLLIGLDGAEGLEEVLHRGGAQLTAAYVGLIDKVLDLRLLGLLDSILVSVGSSFCMAGCHGRVNKIGSGKHTIGHLYFRNFHLFLAECGLERQIEFALLHGGVIGEGVLHRVVAAELVGDFLIVSLYLLTLERGRLSHGRLIAIAQDRLHGNDSFFLHVFFGETTVNRYRHLASHCFERRRGYCKIIGRKFSQLTARRQQ